uniref:Uncharacterized protein n=1 Tax=Rhizophora mucronata TaxID=61149 RepID=A0A2P2IJU0_RHIMU
MLDFGLMCSNDLNFHHPTTLRLKRLPFNFFYCQRLLHIY